MLAILDIISFILILRNF